MAPFARHGASKARTSRSPVDSSRVTRNPRRELIATAVTDPPTSNAWNNRDERSSTVSTVCGLKWLPSSRKYLRLWTEDEGAAAWINRKCAEVCLTLIGRDHHGYVHCRRASDRQECRTTLVCRLLYTDGLKWGARASLATPSREETVARLAFAWSSWIPPALLPFFAAVWRRGVTARARGALQHPWGR